MDDELKGEGNSLNYTYRMHDPRVGRFFAVDSLAPKYPHNSPYAFSENRVLDRNELEGLETGPQWWMQYTPAAKSAGVTTETWSRQFNSSGKEGVIVVGMVESVIDGLTYASTSILQAFVGGVTYGYGDVRYGDGYKTRYDIPSYKFSFGQGFEVDKKFATRGNVDFKDGMRILDGVGSMMTLGEITAFTKIAVTPSIRRLLAEQFYIKAGYSAERMAKHIPAIDFLKGVSTKTYGSGKKLIQYAEKVNGKIKLGDYWALPGADPTKLGIELEGRYLVEAELLENTKFLKSTAADIESWKTPGRMLDGGETQLFKPDARIEIKNVSENPIK